MKTIRIRIPVAVSSSGDWIVAEAGSNYDDPSRAVSLLRLRGRAGDTEHIVWVTADVPLPPTEIVGQVEGGPPAGEVAVPGIEHARDWCKRHGYYVEDDAPGCSRCGTTPAHDTVEERRWRIACPQKMAPAWFDKLMYRKCDGLELSVRADNGLANIGCTCIADVVCLTETDLLRVRNVGRKTLAEVVAELARLGLSLGMGRRFETGPSPEVREATAGALDDKAGL